MPFILPNKVYETIKWLLFIVIPAFGTFYGVLADELGLGATESVLRILFAAAAFLGLVLGVSAMNYNGSDEKYDGTIDPKRANSMTPDETLHIKGYSYPEKEVLLKVVPPPDH